MRVDWEAIHQDIEAEKQYIKELIEKVDTYIKNTLSKTDQYKGVDIGLVYTKLEDDLKKGEFMIWISRSNGMYVNHKFVKLAEIGLEYSFKRTYDNRGRKINFST